jgi:hypothetical protein
MPYFKPFPAADESALKRFGGRAQTVVRRCTRTLCDLQRKFIRLQFIDSTFANSSGRQFWWKRYVTLHLGDQGCGLHRAKLPERASIVSECYYIKCPRRHCVVAGWSNSCVANSQICKDANRQRLIDVKLTTAKRRRMHRMATIECRRSLGS